MTTDITEQAQSHELRNKVNHRLYGALEFQGTSGEHATVTLSIDECKSIIAAMDERLALVEALESKERTIQVLESSYNEQTDAMEKAQAQSSKWLEAYHKAISVGARYEERIAEQEEAEQKLCAANVTLDARAELAERRLLEMESRTVTVKLPPKIERNDIDGWFTYKGGRVGGGAAEWYNKALDDVGSELTATGIKWEAE